MRLCALLVLATGCFAHSATVPTDDHYVRDIKLSATRGATDRPKPDERWWREQFQVEIYKPIE